ncbi:hypothetical protein F511_23383 [Dorcoceras hygrometricum]|uniref:Uncharacterized protein n=1 Tax=Dorcoceras hygrometricum TaxID=472368 RepID=A0A2Z7AIS6_9LAMI|nr:hypothetical protein F511_23383 [Dorcoceras hygrometricum]
MKRLVPNNNLKHMQPAAVKWTKICGLAEEMKRVYGSMRLSCFRTREPNSSSKTPTHISSSGVTRGPSDTLHSRPTILSSGYFPRTLYQDQVLPEDSLPVRGYFPRTMSRRDGEFSSDPRRSRRRYRSPEISAEICSSQPPSPSINTRHQGEVFSALLCSIPDVVPDGPSSISRRGGASSSIEVIWLHQLAPSVGNVEERIQDTTQEDYSSGYRRNQQHGDCISGVGALRLTSAQIAQRIATTVEQLDNQLESHSQPDQQVEEIKKSGRCRETPISVRERYSPPEVRQ